MMVDFGSIAGKEGKRKKYYLTFFFFMAGIVLMSVFIIVRTVYYPMIQVTSFEQQQSFPGYTLFAPTVDDLGFALEEHSTIYLIDVDGKIVHTWNVLGSVQLARIKSDGNLLYTTRDRSFPKRAGLREIDPFGNVLWYYNCRADHDFRLLKNGNVLIHVIEDKLAPAIGPGKVRSPRIIEVSPQQEILWEWRGEEHLDELTNLVGIQFPIEERGQRQLDWAHNNTIYVIGKNKTASRDIRFRPGNIIISYCNLNTIAVIDRTSSQIVWAWGPGVLDGQHSLQMMEDGNLIIFDNGTERRYSRVIIFDPVSEKIVWEYNDKNSKNHKFYSPFLSGAQPLPNGNVLICQGSLMRKALMDKFYRIFHERLLNKLSLSSRLFEVNRKKQIVWDCTITANGKNMHSIYQATRYSPFYVRPLFDKLQEDVNHSARRLKSLPYIR